MATVPLDAGALAAQVPAGTAALAATYTIEILTEALKVHADACASAAKLPSKLPPALSLAAKVSGDATASLALALRMPNGGCAVLLEGTQQSTEVVSKAAMVRVCTCASAALMPVDEAAQGAAVPAEAAETQQSAEVVMAARTQVHR